MLIANGKVKTKPNKKTHFCPTKNSDETTNGKFNFPPTYHLPFSTGLPSADDYLLFHVILL